MAEHTAPPHPAPSSSAASPSDASTPSGTVALIVAAGTGQRFGGEVAKQYRMLAGRTVLARAVCALKNAAGIDAVRAVIDPDQIVAYRAAVAGIDLLEPVAGGDTRQQSVRRGLESVAALNPARVLIHDAARPLVSDALIGRVLAALERADGAVPALPVTDTLKRATESTAGAPPGGLRILETVSRDGLWRAQTPQGFRFGPLLEAHRRHADWAATDDAALIERAGGTVELVMGEEDNMKITGPDDLARAERLLAGAVRVGTGFDVHRFGPGDAVTLCGVSVPHSHGLVGHSDADVGLHALTDAILGAIAAGDIGSHFPPSEPRWQGADSTRFLSAAADLVAAKGGRILAVDVTLICEKPKIGPHRAAMCERIAAVLGLAEDAVSVKATTTEGLGFTGRGEGIAAQAVATVQLTG